MFLSSKAFVGSQHRETKLCRDYWDCIRLLGAFGRDLHSVCGILPTRELLLGLLGWREKRRFVSPLSESPLGQPLVPGSDSDIGLIGIQD
jgi:hypothetical protein